MWKDFNRFYLDHLENHVPFFRMLSKHFYTLTWVSYVSGGSAAQFISTPLSSADLNYFPGTMLLA